MMNRRRFLATSSTLASAAFGGGLPLFGSRAGAEALPARLELKALAHAALDAARSAGARYAEVLFRTTHREAWSPLGSAVQNAMPFETFAHGVGIRALAGGCWGMAGMDGVVGTDDIVRLGRDAVAQAAIGAKAGGRPVELTLAPPVADGHWITPIERDPFEVSAGEKLDFLAGMCDYFARLHWDAGDRISSQVRFQRVDTTLASTDGIDYTQTTYTTGGEFKVVARGDCLVGAEGMCAADFLTPAGAGWEYIRTAPFREAAESLLETADRTRPKEFVELGRYDIVFDAYAMASILSVSLGAATAAERAMGLTAQGAVGTSFLSDPLAMLGALPVAAPNITIRANRGMPRGAATVRWDDEGVTPREITLVRDGVLADLQTTRESAGWLAPYYQRAGRPVHSNGCAGREQATGAPAQCPANVTLSPGREALTFDDLVRSTRRGYAICGTQAYTDWQALTGLGAPIRMYRIRDGKLGQAVNTAAILRYLFRTPEFWKSIVALGGPASARAFGIERQDGGLATAHTVVAVPAIARQLRFINLESGL